jgi:hypothetical protein
MVKNCLDRTLHPSLVVLILPLDASDNNHLSVTSFRLVKTAS